MGSTATLGPIWERTCRRSLARQLACPRSCVSLPSLGRAMVLALLSGLATLPSIPVICWRTGRRFLSLHRRSRNENTEGLGNLSCWAHVLVGWDDGSFFAVLP